MNTMLFMTVKMRNGFLLMLHDAVATLIKNGSIMGILTGVLI